MIQATWRFYFLLGRYSRLKIKIFPLVLKYMIEIIKLKSFHIARISLLIFSIMYQENCKYYRFSCTVYNVKIFFIDTHTKTSVRIYWYRKWQNWLNFRQCGFKWKFIWGELESKFILWYHVNDCHSQQGRILYIYVE